MKTETVGEITLPGIGFGTWKIGGDSSPNPAVEERSIHALRSALDLGYTHFDTAEKYADGHAEELLGQAIRESDIPREQLFITSKVWPNHLRYSDVLKACEGSLRRLKIEYLDLYLIHWPNQLVPLRETFRALNQLVAEGKVHHLGVSNFGIRLLAQSQKLSETGILTDQVPCSLHDRAYIKNGLLAHCQQNGILLTAYSPVENGRLRENPTLRKIAAAHHATPYQIALAWLLARPRVIAIPMSFQRAHQAENLAAGEIALSPAELDQLNSL